MYVCVCVEQRAWKHIIMCNYICHVQFEGHIATLVQDGLHILTQCTNFICYILFVSHLSHHINNTHTHIRTHVHTSKCSTCTYMHTQQECAAMVGTTAQLVTCVSHMHALMCGESQVCTATYVHSIELYGHYESL